MNERRYQDPSCDVYEELMAEVYTYRFTPAQLDHRAEPSDRLLAFLLAEATSRPESYY